MDDKNKKIEAAVGDKPAEPEFLWPVPDERDEHTRELDAAKKRRENLVYINVPWPSGVQINGVLYEGRVHVDEETATEIRRLANHRHAHEIHARVGDGKDDIHMITGTRPLGTW